MKAPVPIFLFALGLSPVVSVGLEAQSTYRVTEIPGGCPNAINNRGQVVGGMNGLNGQTAFLWSTSTGLIDIGAIAGFYQSTANDINDAGQVVGDKSDGPTQGFEDGFLWSPVSGEVDLADLPGSVQTYAQAVAAGGRVTGSNVGLSGYSHGVLWTKGAVMDLGDLPGSYDSSDGLGINDRGEVVGISSSSSGNYAFLWTPQSTMLSLGALPGFTYASFAFDINNRGEAVGASLASPSVGHAALWTAVGGMVDLGELPGGQELAMAYAINDRGQVVGFSTVDAPSPKEHRAFLWEDGSMHDLNDLVDPSDPLKELLFLTQARDINSRGQIVGCGVNVVMDSGAGFLLTPTTEHRGPH